MKNNKISNGVKWLKRIVVTLLIVLIVITVTLWFLARKPVPESITYGMSFNTMYARELGLEWKQTYDALLDEMKIRHLRLAAHWPMIEPVKDTYNFEELDYQVTKAQEVGATVVLAVGRRLPRWPECHVPTWAKEQSWEYQQAEIIDYMTTVVNRYKDNPAIIMWQVENEPYLSLFAFEHCGALDEAFLEQEIALIKSLDATRPVLVTDSGNLGTWKDAYRQGDAFGTSVYVHFWNPELGQFRTFLPPWFYRAKEKVVAYYYGVKPTYLIELSAEPWLVAPVTEVPLETQFTRMDVEKFNDILTYAKDTRYEMQYLWGGEWWYWLLLQNEPAMWERGKEVFTPAPTE